MKKRIALFISIWLLLTPLLFCEAKQRSWSILPIPIIFYDPSAGIAGGTMVVGSFRQNTIQAGGFYTQKRQICTFSDSQFYYPLFRRHALAFQYLMKLGGGDVPLQSLPYLGG